MKIKISWPGDDKGITIDASSSDVVCTDVFCGIGVQTDIGHFGIAQRDGVVEILFNGHLLFSSDRMKMEIEKSGLIDNL